MSVVVALCPGATIWPTVWGFMAWNAARRIAHTRTELRVLSVFKCACPACPAAPSHTRGPGLRRVQQCPSQSVVGWQPPMNLHNNNHRSAASLLVCFSDSVYTTARSCHGPPYATVRSQKIQRCAPVQPHVWSARFEGPHRKALSPPHHIPNPQNTNPNPNPCPPTTLLCWRGGKETLLVRMFTSALPKFPQSKIVISSVYGSVLGWFFLHLKTLFLAQQSVQPKAVSWVLDTTY